jgi:mRNA-degrading endonuclease YafQ of YafQ-DinJ toxin-antitoxin module
LRRALIPSPAFQRAARKTVKKDPTLERDLLSALELLAEDAFDSRLRTHKLKGQLDGSWSCNAGYDLRIIFSFVQHEEVEAILLETCGSHDEVY